MQSKEYFELSQSFDKYTRINKRLLRTVGLWPQDEGREDSPWRRRLAIAYILVLLSLTLTQFHHIYLLIWGNFFECLEILCNTTTSFLIVHKASIFYLKRDIIVDFDEQNKKMWIAEFEDRDNRQMMIESAKTGQTLTYIFCGIVLFTLANFHLAPVVSVYYQWKSGIPSEEFIYILPYLVELPLDLRQPIQHAIAYIPVTICSVSLFYYVTGIDSFYCTAIQHLILHLKLLQRSLTKSVSNELKKDSESKSPLSRLHSCIEKHRTIIKHSEVLEEIYSPIIFGLGVVGTLSMCMVIFHAVITKGGSNGTMSLFLMYLSMEVSEVLLYCWYGNALICTSLEVASALFETDWYDNPRDKKAFADCITIMMIRSQRPIKLTAYKFTDVSLRLFTNIMRTTASYFALLRNLYTN